MSSNLSGVFGLLERKKEAREVARVLGLISDANMAERVRAYRSDEKETDKWLAAAVALLEEDKSEAFRMEVAEEARHLHIAPERIEEYRKNSFLLKRIQTIMDYTSAALLLVEMPGVDEISSSAYSRALEEGKRITEERRKQRNNELFDENIVRRMIPVLVRCENVEGGIVERFFIALHDSFARKVVQDVKERLQQIYPSFWDVIASMEKKVTQKDLGDFFFAGRSDTPLISLARTRHFSRNEGLERKYGMLLERSVRGEELRVLEVVSKGNGPDELRRFIGKTFRYRVNELGGVRYPELRHIRENGHELYRFLLKALRLSGWESPTEWPKTRYPKNW